MNSFELEKIKLMNRMEVLKEKLKLIPKKPGVYLHKDERGEILYIGKAKNLNARLKSYFTNLDRHSAKTQVLVEKIHDFEIIVTENESEALLLENNLIKHNKPQYNFLLRDDKTYPYLKLDLNEAWPRLLKTRQKQKEAHREKVLYFGPYTDIAQLQQILDIINKYFLLIKCKPIVFKTVTRPCNYYDIKRCLAPCKIPVSKKEYFEQIESVIAILNGKTKETIVKIKTEIQKNVEIMNFEKAAILRDQLTALLSFSSEQYITFDTDLNIDIIGSYWHTDVITFYISQVREGKLIGGIPFALENLIEEPLESCSNLSKSKKTEQTRTFCSFVYQYYQNNPAPEFVLFDDKNKILSSNDIHSISFIIAQINHSIPSKVRFYSDLKKIQKSIKLKTLKNMRYIVNLSEINAENKFQERMKSDKNHHNMLVGLKEFLNLTFIPLYIECYDISTFQGTETVASQVVFKNGKPFKDEYRKYIIKALTTIQNDDFASLREVIKRRFKISNKIKLPDLILIDGGTPQIREVALILKSLNLDQIFIAGIAKSRTQSNFTASTIEKTFERLVIPRRNKNNELLPNEEPETKILKQNSPEYRLLTQLRDEAHRFAITFHRKRRDKITKKASK